MKHVFILALSFLFVEMSAQTTQWGVPTGNVKFPKGEYKELPDPARKDAAAWKSVKGTNLSWGTTDLRYSKGAVPALKKKVVTESLKGWRGERVSAQALVWSATPLANLTFEMSSLKGKSSLIPASAAFVRYVMQDNFLTCGYRKSSSEYDSTLIAEPIDHLAKCLPLEAQTARPIWVSVWIPQSATAGDYKGVLTVKNGATVIGKLNLSVNVVNRVLPKPTEWSYHLDFWQNPFAEARYAGLKVFTPEFFEFVRPQFERLRDAGQKVITTSIMHKPWGGQTEDYFESMITWMKRADGTWAFDYTAFDLWVNYMMKLGIDKQIACYSMIPWNMSFKYYDQTTNSMQELKTTTDTPEYAEMWTAVLQSLSKHLREKGWFDRTVIAMDERSPKDMQNAFRIIATADPEFKVSLAGSNHPEMEAQLYDYSMASDDLFKPEVLAKRHAKGQKSTFYTCCAQKYPNMFTYSLPAENEWISWFAAAKGYDGYLRWAYNSYTKEPLLDARFRAFQSGDSYLVYPEARTSIRFEKFVDGVEMYEKIALLRKDFKAKGDTKSLKQIDKVLKTFSIENFKRGIAPQRTLNEARKAINAL
ncbi:MAG: DUF4091 domain-containing protein [Bacteroidaceae bacterium]